MARHLQKQIDNSQIFVTRQSLINGFFLLNFLLGMGLLHCLFLEPLAWAETTIGYYKGPNDNGVGPNNVPSVPTPPGVGGGAPPSTGGGGAATGGAQNASPIRPRIRPDIRQKISPRGAIRPRA
jgi:hypothetical protein